MARVCKAPFGYRRLGRKMLRNGKLPKLRNSLKKRARSQPSGPPRNDGGRSFSTKERLAASTEGTRKAPISSENDAFRATFGCRSENYYPGAPLQSALQRVRDALLGRVLQAPCPFG